MTKRKLGPIADDKPIRITVELPAALHRDLTDYGRPLAEGGTPVEPMCSLYRGWPVSSCAARVRPVMVIGASP